jgi:CRISPR type IV-associated protein Csf3
MDRFKVTMALGSPIVSNGGYMTLDALLAALIFEATGDLEQAHATIPLANTDGLWHASAAMVEKTDAGRVSFVANLRAAHDLDLGLIAKNPKGNTHTALGLTRRRDFGAVMNSYKLFTAPAITWYAQGDALAVERLLRDVGFIGKRRASGYGQVTGLSLEAADLDGVTGFFGEPLRPVPVALFKGNDTALRADAAWRPAYWHPANRAICFVPEAH